MIFMSRRRQLCSSSFPCARMKKKPAHSRTCHWSLLFLKAAANSSHKLKTTHLRKFKKKKKKKPKLLFFFRIKFSRFRAEARKYKHMKRSLGARRINPTQRIKLRPRDDDDDDDDDDKSLSMSKSASALDTRLNKWSQNERATQKYQKPRPSTV